MALVIKDRVKEATSSTGTGTITLNGATSGFQSFSAIGDGNTTYYAIIDSANADWEVGIGTYTATGTTLSRTTVLESSNSGSLVSFASGVKSVFATYPAEKAVFLDASGNLTISGDIAVTGTVDGRDIAADGTKLDGIEAGADVTDTANVTAAGALMDSELTSIASVKALNQGVSTTSSPTFSNITATGNTVTLGTSSSPHGTFVLSTANWNYSPITMHRHASNSNNVKTISMLLDGDNSASTTIGDANAIWGMYSSAPTTGSTSASLSGQMAYGAYSGHKWYSNGSNTMSLDASGNLTANSFSGSGAALTNIRGRKNHIINGSMNVWQRGTGTFTTNSSFSADRWRIWAASVALSTDVPSGEGFSYSLKNTTSSTGGWLLQHGVELPSLGKAGHYTGYMTFSFWGKFDSGKLVTVASWFADSSGGGNQSAALWYTDVTGTGSWQRYSVTVNSSVTPNASNQCMRAIIYDSHAQSWTTYAITGVQLELSPTMSDFEFLPIAEEVSLCMRYYETSNGLQQASAGSTGFGGNTYWGGINYAVQKRVTPSLAFSDVVGTAGTATCWTGATQYNGRTVHVEVNTPQMFGGGVKGEPFTDAGLARFNWSADAEV